MTQALIASTWLVWILASLGNGLSLVRLTRSKMGIRSELQFALWLGVLSLVAAALLLNLFIGNASRVAAVLMVLWLTAGSAALVFWAFNRRAVVVTALSRAIRISNWPSLLLGFVVLLAILVMANFAAAEPMDYDAGLYRMGVINYAAEYRVIPGLANLHDRFGFNSFLGPVAGWLGTGLWQQEGFRLISGLFVSALFVDVLLRIVVPRRKTPGDYFLTISAGFVCWVVLTDSGRWIPSPAVDVIALTLVAIVIGYLADFASSKGTWLWQIQIIILVSSLAAAIRPLAWILVPLVCVSILASFRKPMSNAIRSREVRVKIGFSLLISSALLVAMLLRDVLLSGWLLFPISTLPIPVDWQTPDPTGTRLGITWYARAGSNMAEAEQIGWFTEWISSFMRSQELKAWGLLLVAGIIPLLWQRGRQAWTASWYAMVIVAFPPAVLTVVWFVTAPDVRFNWGGLLGVSAVPLAFLLTRNAYPRWIVRAALIVLLVFGIVTNTRNGRLEPRGRPAEATIKQFLGRDVELRLGAPNQVVTIPGELADGTPVVYPAEGENCYMVFPLCLLPGGGSSVEMRGKMIEQGFRQQ